MVAPKARKEKERESIYHSGEVVGVENVMCDCKDDVA